MLSIPRNIIKSRSRIIGRSLSGGHVDVHGHVHVNHARRRRRRGTRRRRRRRRRDRRRNRRRHGRRNGSRRRRGCRVGSRRRSDRPQSGDISDDLSRSGIVDRPEDSSRVILKHDQGNQSVLDRRLIAETRHQGVGNSQTAKDTLAGGERAAGRLVDLQVHRVPRRRHVGVDLSDVDRARDRSLRAGP